MIYVHVPFCKSFCTYCGFYSELCGKSDFETYAQGVCKEIEDRTQEILSSAKVNTLYFGGGTPSVLPLDCIKKIVKALPFDSHSYEEFTLEMNPDDVTPELANGLADIGVNRISLGIQSFDDDILRWMNRRHSADGAMRAVEILQQSGFRNISIDLIFGLPLLTDKIWQDTLDKAVSLGVQHISAYQLSVEEDSALERMLLDGRFREATQEKCSEQYDRLCNRLAGAGFRHYEVSNFALSGKEAVHNSAYWTRQRYVGLGPGAHSFDGAFTRSWNPTLEGGRVEKEVLSPEDVNTEVLMLGLRTAAGLPSDVLDSLIPRNILDRSIGEGRLVPTEGGYRIPESKFFVSDDIISFLATALN